MGGLGGLFQGDTHQLGKHLPCPQRGPGAQGGAWRTPCPLCPSAPPPAHAHSLPWLRRLAQGPSGKLDLKADNF